MKIINIAIIVLVVLVTSAAQCAVYYVDGVSGKESNPGTMGRPWKSIHKANITLQAGDTVYIRAGIYTVGDPWKSGGRDKNAQGVCPKNSGAIGKVITYRNYSGEKVNFVGNHNRSFAVDLDGKSYIRVTGIDFSNFYLFMHINNGGNHNEIDHCTFDQVRYYNNDGLTVYFRGSTIYHNSTHNYIHDNTFSNYGAYTTTNQLGVVFEVGIDTASPIHDDSSYNTIENNQFYHGGHHVLGINSRYNVIRNNNIHNESWWAGPGCEIYANRKCGYRVVSMVGYDNTSGNNLIEGNRISYGGPEISPMAGGSGLTAATSYNIIRYNDFYDNGIYGLRFGSSLKSTSSYNHLYNNTFYHNGYGTDAVGIIPQYRTGLYFNTAPSSVDSCVNNVIKNNLFHANNNINIRRVRTISYGYDGSASFQIIENNCEECTSDPKFVNQDISDPMSKILPDLSLQSSSPVKDKGTYLTRANGAGSSSTTLIVGDARYFQDRTWGSDLARDNLNADRIAIGKVDSVVQISSINYATKTITLASPMTWKNGDYVWLYKKSDGTRVMYGLAPDMGAHEYAK